MIELKNEQLTVRIAEKGAELQSVKDNQSREYMWQAGPEWARHSPILFPIVCSVNDNTYRVDGKEYHLPRHGFARDMEFTVNYQSENDVSFLLEYSEETLKVYPYRFKLGIRYFLEENTIFVHWYVKNIDKQEIHFQIGGHPAFNMPSGKLEGEIFLSKAAEPMVALKSYPDGSHDMEEVPLEIDGQYLHICNDFFRNDSVKIHKSQTYAAGIVDTDGHLSVIVNYEAPVCAIWSPYGKQAPFVCIEPWYGIGDPRGFKGEFKDKPLMNHLLPGAQFHSTYVISFGNK